MALKRIVSSQGNTPKAPPSMPAIPKMFSVEDWDGSKEGEKIIIYADSGLGKTTLASMAPNPVYLGLDDGGRKIRNPKTGEMLKHIPGLTLFRDVLAVLQQPELFDDFSTVILDTATILEEWAAPYVLETIPNEKGTTMKNLVQYGYNKGYQHLYNTMKLIPQACDSLVRSGKHVIIICQEAANRVPNSGGDDFLRAGPRLTSNKEANIEGHFCEWADHVFRITYSSQVVKDRKATSTDERVIYVKGEVHFRAKSRTLPADISCVTFADKADDSIWQFLFKKGD
jgi:hypothetical protein